MLVLVLYVVCWVVTMIAAREKPHRVERCLGHWTLGQAWNTLTEYLRLDKNSESEVLGLIGKVDKGGERDRPWQMDFKFTLLLQETRRLEVTQDTALMRRLRAR